MKDIPGNLPINAYYAITCKKISQISTSCNSCLFGEDDCRKAIRSHSVSVAALRSIANDGHVYTFTSPTHDELARIYNAGKYRPKSLSINEASTYYGFCSNHDDSIFSEIEKTDITPTGKQIFLFHFRAYSRVFYLNKTAGQALREIYNAKLPDGHNPIDALATVASHFQPQGEAFSDLNKNFESMRLCLSSKNIPILEHIFIRINCTPEVMCSTIFVPIYDINGDFLLDIEEKSELDSCQAMSITISKDLYGGFILLVWNCEDKITSTFIKTFIKSGYDLNRLIAVIFGNTENIFFNKNWWNKLDDELTSLLMYFSSVQFMNSADPARDHLQLMHKIIAYNQKKYLNWSILSASSPDGTQA